MASPDEYGVPYSQQSAYSALIHEFGHNAIGAYDEYNKFNIDDYPAQCTLNFDQVDYSDRASIMYNPRDSSEFCATIAPIVHNPDTSQGYIQGESVWETLVDNWSDQQGLWELRSPITRGVEDSGPVAPLCLSTYGASVQTFNSPGPTCTRPIQVAVLLQGGQPAAAVDIGLTHNNSRIVEPNTDREGDSFVLGASTGDTIDANTFVAGHVLDSSATIANCQDLITITLTHSASVSASSSAGESEGKAGASQAKGPVQSPEEWPAYWLEAVPDWVQSRITATLHLSADPPAQPTLYASQDSLNRQQLTLTYNSSLHQYTGTYTFSPTRSPDFLFELGLPNGTGTAAPAYNFTGGQFHSGGPSGYEQMKNLGAPTL